MDAIQRLGISPAIRVEIAGTHVAGRIPHSGQTAVVDHGIYEVEVVLPGPIPVNGHPTDSRRIHSQRHIVSLIDKREVNKEMLSSAEIDWLARVACHNPASTSIAVWALACAPGDPETRIASQIVPRAKP